MTMLPSPIRYMLIAMTIATVLTLLLLLLATFGIRLTTEETFLHNQSGIAAIAFFSIALLMAVIQPIIQRQKNRQPSETDSKSTSEPANRRVRITGNIQ